MMNLPLQVFDHGLGIPNRMLFSRVRLGRASNLCSFEMEAHSYLISTHRTRAEPCQAEYISRRSSDYHPTIWDPQHIESIRSPYNIDDKFNAHVEELKQLLKETDKPLARLELIDSIRRLGVAYHFEEEIRDALVRSYVDGFDSLRGLRETALCFRLLREDRQYVSSDVFKKFKEGEKFMNCLTQDVMDLLSLYEATQLALPEEQILEEAKEFSIKHLQCLRDGNIDVNQVKRVRHSLDAPLHWLMPRLEARRFIDLNEKDEGKISCLLELAKLDFNVVQSMHQKDIKELSRWWEQLDLVNKVDFSRDRIFENYLWGNGIAPEPQFSKCRKISTKLISIVNVIDDFYDTYGSLEEAELFTAAIRRWDLKAMEDLPHYLKLCYLAVYNFVNDTAYDILKEYGWDVRHLLAREWICLCEAYLKEAKWFHKKITPPLEEYLENGWTSIGNRILIFHALYYAGHELNSESFDHLEQAYQLIRVASLLVRLIDDLAPSKAEVEASLSIQCRMKDSGESYETAKEFIKNLINDYWKELNKGSLNKHLPQNFVRIAMNSVRACYSFFKEGDCLGDSAGITKDRINLLFVEPILLE